MMELLNDKNVSRSFSGIQKEVLIIDSPTLILVDGESLVIDHSTSSIYMNDCQMAVIVEPGEYGLHYDLGTVFHTQTLHGSDFNFSGNFVVNIEDCHKAVKLLDDEIPLFELSDRLITIGYSNVDNVKYKDRVELFTHNDVTIYSCSKRQQKTEKQKIYDAVVIGAGPYGTSAAISLKSSGLDAYWVGEPLSFWLRNIQPTSLRSVKAATNIYTANSGYTFIDFCDQYGIEHAGKIQFWQFLAYYFHLINQFDVLPSYEKVMNVKYANGLWYMDVHGANGKKTIIAKNVVNATGIGMHPNMPPVVSSLSKKMSPHVSQLAAHAFPEDKNIAVIGGAQSAIEYALQADSLNNNVTLYVREELKYRNLHEPAQVIYRYLASNCEKIIGFLPLRLKTKLLNFLLEGTCDPKVEDELRCSNINVIENTDIKDSYQVSDDEAVLVTHEGERKFHYVISATGYYYNVNDVNYLSAFLDKSKHVIADRFPNINKNAMLKNAPKGMYFTGYSCLYRIGFKTQFINGTNIVVKRIIDDIKRKA